MAALILFSAALIAYDQGRRTLLAPPQPAEVDPATVTSYLRWDNDTSRLLQGYTFDAIVREVCGGQTLFRNQQDQISAENVAPIVTQAPADPKPIIGFWLPPGLHRNVITEVLVQPGKKGTITLAGYVDFCPSGYRGFLLVYTLPFDWRGGVLARVDKDGKKLMVPVQPDTSGALGY